jgi:hypothetical protein
VVHPAWSASGLPHWRLALTGAQLLCFVRFSASLSLRLTRQLQLLRSASALSSGRTVGAVPVFSRAFSSASTPAAPAVGASPRFTLPAQAQQQSKQEQQHENSAPTPVIPNNVEWDAIIVGGSVEHTWIFDVLAAASRWQS